jgi:hypothetical protein
MQSPDPLAFCSRLLEPHHGNDRPTDGHGGEGEPLIQTLPTVCTASRSWMSDIRDIRVATTLTGLQADTSISGPDLYCASRAQWEMFRVWTTEEEVSKHGRARCRLADFRCEAETRVSEQLDYSLFDFLCICNSETILYRNYEPQYRRPFFDLKHNTTACRETSCFQAGVFSPTTVDCRWEPEMIRWYRRLVSVQYCEVRYTEMMLLRETCHGKVRMRWLVCSQHSNSTGCRCTICR